MNHSAPIADAHLHLWDLSKHCHPWLEKDVPSGPFGSSTALKHSYLLDDFRRDTEGQNLRRIVHVEAGWDADDPVGETLWIQSLAEEYGAPHAIIARANLASDRLATILDAHALASPLFRGVRDRLQRGDFLRNGVPQVGFDDPAWRRGVAMLGQRGLVLELQAPPSLMPQALKLADAHRDVRFVLTHAGYPPAIGDRSETTWRAGIRALADCPNVVVKLSGLVLGERRWDPVRAQSLAARLIEAFGPSRVLVGSNFPVDRLFIDANGLFSAFRDWVADLPPKAQSTILYENACRTYGMA